MSRRPNPRSSQPSRVPGDTDDTIMRLNGFNVLPNFGGQRLELNRLGQGGTLGGQVRHMFAGFEGTSYVSPLMPVVLPVYRAYLRTRVTTHVEGADLIPKTGPGIIAYSHRSRLDP